MFNLVTLALLLLTTPMLGKNLISSVITQIPIFILGIVSGIFSTRILGEEAKGIFSLFQANYLLFYLVFSFGIQSGMVYFISSKKYSEELVAGIAISICLFSSALLFCFFILSSYLNFTDLYLPENYLHTSYIIALFLLFFFTFINSLLTSFFQARSMFKLINWVSVFNSILNALFFTLLYFHLKDSTITAHEKFNYVLISTLVLLVINSVLWIYLYITQISVVPIFGKEILTRLKEFINYSILIYIGMFVNFFNYRLDLWVVNHYLDEKQLSHYSLAANISQIILYLSVTIGSVLFPYLSNGSDENRLTTFIQISRFSFLFFLVLVFIAFISSFFIIPFMYGEEFVNTVIPFQILSIGILFSCITQIFSTLLVSFNKNIYNIIACSIGLVVTVYFDIYLIPKYDIIGASYATLISYLVIFILTYIFVLTKLTIKTKNLFLPTKKDIAQLYLLINPKKPNESRNN